MNEHHISYNNSCHNEPLPFRSKKRRWYIFISFQGNINNNRAKRCNKMHEKAIRVNIESEKIAIDPGLEDIITT
jgi:hypothetical protein